MTSQNILKIVWYIENVKSILSKITDTKNKYKKQINTYIAPLRI